MKNRILLIDNSVALSTSLKVLLETEIGIEVVSCSTLAEAEVQLVRGDLAFAITGSSLADASFDTLLKALDAAHVPAIVLTGTQDETAESNYTKRGLIEYIVKEDRHSFDKVVSAARRIYENQKTRVLVVDDARSTRSRVANLLKKQNFLVHQASSGRNALALLAQFPDVRLVITDYLMPDMDGYDLVKRIRAERNSQELRIIGISGSDDRHLSAQFLRAGASDFIHSPFIPEEFQCRINNNIETLRQLDSLRRQAQSDPLTGIANRRHFFELGQRRANQHSDEGLDGALALIDIDFFKQINDRHGHSAGDKVLIEISRTLSRMADGAGHLAARYGGEEFCLLLAELSGRKAHDFCEEVRRAIEALEIGHPAKPIKVTASIGVCDLQAGTSFDALLQTADRLLYLAKDRGRNRVESATSTPRQVTTSDAA